MKLLTLAFIWLLTAFGVVPDVYNQVVFISEVVKPFVPLLQILSLSAATVASIIVIRKKGKK